MNNTADLPIIGESAEAKALRELEARIERLPHLEQAAVWACVGAIDNVLAQFDPPARVLATLYTSRVLAARFREAKNAEEQAKQTPH